MPMLLLLLLLVLLLLHDYNACSIRPRCHHHSASACCSYYDDVDSMRTRRASFGLLDCAAFW